MLYNTGYRGEVDREFIPDTSGITIGSCGHFKLLTLPTFRTQRPGGRRDFQLLYVAKGQAVFHLRDEVFHLEAGDTFLYFPDEPQLYIYHLSENPDIYWIHFYEMQPYPILSQLGFLRSGHYALTPDTECILLFEKIIRELQTRRRGFELLCDAYGMTLLTLLSRHFASNSLVDDRHNTLLEHVLHDIHQDFNAEISIQAYAQKHHMSTCWLIRSFKRRTGMTPQQYIIHLRVNKAKELLRTSDFNVSEIAAYVGYPNPLYFSRIFSKVTGQSPSDYRRTTG